MDESEMEMTVFTSQGYFKDEVTLEFEDQKMLYVSQALLSLFSPVFEAMFNDEFREKQEKKVKLVGKIYEDTLEFLLCMYPRSNRHIDETNVLRVAPMAEEYQVLSLITACQEFMKKWLKRTIKETAAIQGNIKKMGETLDKGKINKMGEILDNAKISVDIICAAAKLGYYEVCTYAAEVIAKYPFGIYKTLVRDKLMADMRYNASNREKLEECRKRFSSLPAEWKYAIALNRLSFFETNEFHC